MSRAPTDHLTQDHQSQGASLRPARLAGIDGHGTLQVLRDGAGAEVSVEGTWRPADPDAPVGPLLRAADQGETVRFEGSLDDTTVRDAEPVEVDVRVSSHGIYTFEQEADVGDVDAGETRRIFNFAPVDGSDAL